MLFMSDKEITNPSSIISQYVLGTGVIGYFSPTPPDEIGMQLMWKELKHKQRHTLRVCLLDFVPVKIFRRSDRANRHRIYFYTII